jgi:hypothetical protein
MAVDRYKLRFGPYRTPRFKIGEEVLCARRGRVKIVGISDALVVEGLAARKNAAFPRIGGSTNSALWWLVFSAR